MAHQSTNARTSWSRRLFLGAAAACAVAIPLASFGAELSQSEASALPPLQPGALEGSASTKGMATIIARVRQSGFGAGLWIRNDGATTLRKVHAVVRAKDGTAEAFFVRFQWEGELAPGASVNAGALGFGFESMTGAPKPRASTVVAELVYASSDSGSVGKPAPWSASPQQMEALSSEMGAGLDADAKKAMAYAKSKGGSAAPVSGFAKLWAPPGLNPYDPAELRVAIAWRAESAPADIKGMWSSFYQSPSLAPFLRMELAGNWRLAPKERGMVLASFGSAACSDAFRRSFEAKAKSHGVDVGRSYIDLSKPMGAAKKG